MLVIREGQPGVKSTWTYSSEGRPWLGCVDASANPEIISGLLSHLNDRLEVDPWDLRLMSKVDGSSGGSKQRSEPANFVDFGTPQGEPMTRRSPFVSALLGMLAYLVCIVGVLKKE